MRKKYLLPVIMFLQLSAQSAFAQNEPVETFNPKTYNPVYRLGFPKGWSVERFAIPIDFAPKIPFKGVEDLRFTPGWADTASAEHWSYCFLWWLEGDLRFNSSTMELCLWQYYNGLVGRNIIKRNIPNDKVVRVSTDAKKIKKEPGDDETYQCEVHMLNYMNLQPIDLHLKVHLVKCKQQTHTALFFEVSPRPSDDPVWKSLHNARDGFQCEK